MAELENYSTKNHSLVETYDCTLFNYSTSFKKKKNQQTKTKQNTPPQKKIIVLQNTVICPQGLTYRKHDRVHIK